MVTKVKDITNNLDEEIVFGVIDIISGTVVTKGTIPPNTTIPVTYDDNSTYIVLLYKKLDPEYSGIILLE